jgi:hypothetical protein
VCYKSGHCFHGCHLPRLRAPALFCISDRKKGRERGASKPFFSVRRSPLFCAGLCDISVSPDTISSHARCDSPPRCSCDAGSVSRRRAGDIHAKFCTPPWLKRPARHQTSVSLPTAPSHPIAAPPGRLVKERVRKARPQEHVSLGTATLNLPGPKRPRLLIM